MELRARDVMQSTVKTVDPEMTLGELERTPLAEYISGAPVLVGKRVVGIVSRSDIVRQLSVERTLADVARDFYREGSPSAQAPVDDAARTSEIVAKRLATLRVKDAMIRDLIAVAPDAPLPAVAKLMVEHRIHRLLVTEREVLLGIISTLDLIRLLADGKVTTK